MENIRKRVDVRLATSKEKLLKLASKPTYVSSKIFNENLVAVHKIKETLTLNRPAYIGMCILDLSKTLMTYEIETKDAYADFWSDKDRFDNSDYNKESPFYNTANKKVIGKFKDEACGVPVVEFIGLRSKMYNSYIKNNDEGGKTAKGIKKNIITKNINMKTIKKYYSTTNKCIIP